MIPISIGLFLSKLVANCCPPLLQRHGIEEILRDLAGQGSPEATIKGLQLELEKMQWRHQQELTEVKQNIEVMMKEMKANLTKESQRTIEEFKKQAELERLKAVAEAKKKRGAPTAGRRPSSIAAGTPPTATIPVSRHTGPPTWPPARRPIRTRTAAVEATCSAITRCCSAIMRPTTINNNNSSSSSSSIICNSTTTRPTRPPPCSTPCPARASNNSNTTLPRWVWAPSAL